MHVISYRRLREYAEKHATIRDALDSWYKISTKLVWENLLEVQAFFPKVEAVGNFTVFNIKGNEQDAIYELLVVLIERFEQEFYKPNLESNPGSMLAFLMDQRDLQPIDLISIFGSEVAVNEVISGKKMIARSTADRLSELFHVDPSLFK